MAAMNQQASYDLYLISVHNNVPNSSSKMGNAAFFLSNHPKILFLVATYFKTS